MEKFTKGEWVNIKNQGDYLITTELRINNKIVPITVIDTDFSGAVGEEQKANAHLIAAAPKMYEIIKVLSDCIREHGVTKTDEVEFLSILDSTLKKARGEHE